MSDAPSGYQSIVGKSLSYILANGNFMAMPLRCWTISSKIRGKTAHSDSFQQSNNCEFVYAQPPGTWTGFTNTVKFCPAYPTSAYSDVAPWFGPTLLIPGSNPAEYAPDTWGFCGVPNYNPPCDPFTGITGGGNLVPLPNPFPHKWVKREQSVVVFTVGYHYESFEGFIYDIQVEVAQETAWKAYTGNQLCGLATDNFDYRGPQRRYGGAHPNADFGVPYDQDFSLVVQQDIGLGLVDTTCWGGIPHLDDAQIITPLYYGPNQGSRPATPSGTLNYPFGSTGDDRWLKCFNDGAVGTVPVGTRLVNALKHCEPYDAGAIESLTFPTATITDPQVFWLDDAQWLIDYPSTNQKRAQVRRWRRQYRDIRIFVTDQLPQPGWISLRHALAAYPLPEEDPTVTGMVGNNPACDGSNPFDLTEMAIIDCCTETARYTTGWEPPWFTPPILEQKPSVRDWRIFSVFTEWTPTPLTYSGWKPSVQGAISNGPGLGALIVWSDPVLIREIHCFSPIVDKTIVWLDPANPGSRVSATLFARTAFFDIAGDYRAGVKAYWGCGGPTTVFSMETSDSLESAITVLSTVAGRDPGVWLIPAALDIVPKEGKATGDQPIPRALRMAIEPTPPDWRATSTAALDDFERYPFRGVESWPALVPLVVDAVYEYQGCYVRIWVRSDPLDADRANWGAYPKPLPFIGSPEFEPPWPDELTRYDAVYERKLIEHKDTGAPFPFNKQAHQATRKGGLVADWMRNLMSKRTGRPCNIAIQGFENLWGGELVGGEPVTAPGGLTLDWNMVRSTNRWTHFGELRGIGETTYLLADTNWISSPAQRLYASMLYSGGINKAGYNEGRYDTFRTTNAKRFSGVDALPPGQTWNY